MKMTNNYKNNTNIKKYYKFMDYLKFILPSLLGVFMVMVPFTHKGETTIIVALLSNLTSNLLGSLIPYIITIFIGITCILTTINKFKKIDFIENNAFFKSIFDVSAIWTLIRLLGFVFAFMTLFKIGPKIVWSENTGGLILFDLLAGLFTTFFFAGVLLPFLTDFGLLEFVGILLTPVMRPLFKLPGRSSVNCVASWIGDGTVGVALTNQQYLTGYYTEREAAIISTTFSAVSITFCLVVLKQVKLAHMFGKYYMTIVAVGIIAAIIMPRIPPLSRKLDRYYKDKPADISEDIPSQYTNLEWSLHLAIQNPGLRYVFKNGFKTAFDLWLGVLPVIMAFGTTAVIIAEYTNFFQILGKPFLPILLAFKVPEAVEASQAIMVSFSDMFLPSILASTIKSDMTRFIIATLSVSQLVYLSEAGAVILGTEIPISPLDLFIIFIERTIITLPLIIIIAKFLF